MEFQEIMDHAPDGVGGEVPVSDLVDLDGRGEGAAAQAGDFLDGEKLVGVGVLVVFEVELTADGVVNQRSAFDMTGGADTNADHVFPDGAVAKLTVKSGDAGDGGRGNLRYFTDPIQGRFG